MALSRRRHLPLPDLALLQREINQLFERLLEFQSAEGGSGGAWRPGVDVYEARGRLVVVVEVPGVAPESLKVTLHERELVLSGERLPPREKAEHATFLCVERPHGHFRRAIPLDAAVDAPQAEARLQNGLLVVELPRLKERRGREIVIPVERESE
jgi:HSP20 family protein